MKIKHILFTIFFLLIFSSCETRSDDLRPNFVFILADDLGYGDLSSYGSKNIETTNIDKLAKDGIKLTSSYAAQPICSASRGTIATGRYRNRIGIHNAFGPNSNSGINQDEYTLAEILKENGYNTGIYGKWHLGSRKEFFPTNHGFDQFYGILYSNDMWPFHAEYPNSYPDLMLYDYDKPVEVLTDQSDLTMELTKKSISFIEENKETPFFLYLAHPQPHVPLFASSKFNGRSDHGLYGLGKLCFWLPPRSGASGQSVFYGQCGDQGGNRRKDAAV